MPHISYERNEITFKLVYYGPGMSGKTTNLACIHARLDESVKRGDLVSLDTDEDRTLFFDFFPLELGTINGFSLRFNMYTVPGQVYYEASRRLILDGADGVAFVADSQPPRLADNQRSLRAMLQNLRSYHLDPQTFPMVLQYNKRDCQDPIDTGSLLPELPREDVPVFEAIAIEGRGVMETAHSLSRQVVEKFRL